MTESVLRRERCSSTPHPSNLFRPFFPSLCVFSSQSQYKNSSGVGEAWAVPLSPNFNVAFSGGRRHSGKQLYGCSLLSYLVQLNRPKHSCIATGPSSTLESWLCLNFSLSISSLCSFGKLVQLALCVSSTKFANLFVTVASDWARMMLIDVLWTYQENNNETKPQHKSASERAEMLEKCTDKYQALVQGLIKGCREWTRPRNRDMSVVLFVEALGTKSKYLCLELSEPERCRNRQKSECNATRSSMQVEPLLCKCYG
jgi:hypothetical protein